MSARFHTAFAKYLVIKPGYGQGGTMQNMNLNQFAAQKRLTIYEDLKKGIAPSEGEFDEIQFKEARTKGNPQMGKTEYQPDKIIFEYVFPDSKTIATVLQVAIPSPQRIVYLPVPKWVVEQIWQGEISGSYQFLGDAEKMLSDFTEQLSVDENLKLFGGEPPKKRE